MLAEILTGREDAIAKRWLDLVFETYPRETARLLKGERDPFSNPVGQMLREAVGPLVRALSEDEVDRECLSSLSNLMRVRSVQDLTASQAVGIVPLLRNAVLKERGQDFKPEALSELVEKVERLTLAAFDVFVGCREQLFESRSRELVRRQSSLLKRAEKVLAGQGIDGATGAVLDEDSLVNQGREI